MLVGLLDDPDPTVRAAALDSVVPADASSRKSSVGSWRRSRSPALPAARPPRVRRLGDSAVPLLAAALARDGASRRPPLIRAAASAAAEHGLGVIEPALRDGDRVVVLAALDALDAAGGAGVVPPDLLDGVFHDAAAHASRTLAARASLAASDGPLRRALEDESDLARRLVIAVLALRHGARVRDAIRVVDRAEGQRRALGVEALDVLISREEAAVALPLVRRDLTPDEQAAALQHVGPSGAVATTGSRRSRKIRGRLALALARPLRTPRYGAKRGRTPTRLSASASVLRADRLGDVVVHPGCEARLAVLEHGVRGHRDDPRTGLGRPRAQMRREASRPSISGICTSIRTTSYGSRSSASSASSPFDATSAR